MPLRAMKKRGGLPLHPMKKKGGWALAVLHAHSLWEACNERCVGFADCARVRGCREATQGAVCLRRSADSCANLVARIWWLSQSHTPSLLTPSLLTPSLLATSSRPPLPCSLPFLPASASASDLPALPSFHVPPPRHKTPTHSSPSLAHLRPAPFSLAPSPCRRGARLTCRSGGARGHARPHQGPCRARHCHARCDALRHSR